MELPPRRGGDLILSMQLSLFYKLVSLLCCIQFLNWRLCPLGSEYPCCGLGPGLDWEELKVMASVFRPGISSPTGVEGKMDSTVRASRLAGALSPEGLGRCLRLPEL